MGQGRAPCCDKSKVKRGPWCAAEDLRLKSFIEKHGCTNWRALPKQAGLLRCGKSCRLRWINYLRPDVKRGNFTPEEEQTIINLHNSFGNKWSKIASCLPGRTDNEIKNVWNTHLKKKLSKNAIESCQKTKADDPKTDNAGSPFCSITTFEDQNREKKEAQKTEAHDDSKTDNSGSPSCSITSFEDQNTDKKEGDVTVKESRIQKSYEKLESLLKSPRSSDGESKETGTSDSPISSHVSSFSNSNRDPVSFVANQENGPNHGNGAIQFDSDIDFWELLDSLDPLQSTQTEENGVNVDFSLFNTTEKFDSEVECNKWLRFLENELGLTSDNVLNDQEMDFEPKICHAMDCSSIWNYLT